MQFESDIEQKENPRQNASICSIATFWWMNPLLWLGWKKEMQMQDIPKVLNGDSAKLLGDKLELAWNEEMKHKKNEAKLLNALNKVFRQEWFWSGFFVVLVECCLKVLLPVLMSWLISSFKEDKTSSETWTFALGLIITGIVSAFLTHMYNYFCVHLGMRLAVAISALIYRKALTINKGAGSSNSLGQMVNMLSNDVIRLDLACHFIHFIWVAPLQLIMVLIITWYAMGPSTLAGAVLLVAFASLQSCIGKIFSRLRLETAEKTDKRINLMSEIISGIKVIKMSAWEKPFTNLISRIRNEEIQVIRKSTYFKSINIGFSYVVHKLIILAILAVFSVIEGKDLIASDIFLTQALYFTLSYSITRVFPDSVAKCIESHVSIRRIQTFLEIEDGCISNMDLSEVVELKMDNVFAQWKSNESMRSRESLIDISFHLQTPQLCAIIGPVGSGKSTLLNAILGELPIHRGVIKCNRTKLSYASQEPWIFSSTVCQNIIFGQPFEKNRYLEVIAVTALDVDISSWEDGDQTLVGDRGIILSGGQKARINLARCIYRDADLYLLDDPLSAVDVHVGRHMYQNCIRGFLKEKMVVLVTHQIHYLKDADEILELKNGMIYSRGTFAQLIKNSTYDFTSFINEDENFLMTVGEQIDKEEKLKKKDQMGKMQDRIQMEGNSKSLFDSYVKFVGAAGSPFLWLSLLLSSILSQVLFSISDVFLGYWVNQEEIENLTDQDNSMSNMQIFSGLITIIVISSIGIALLHFITCLKSAENLHNNMFSKILHTNSRFFDVNPAGRILNRFSKDMGAVDELLPQCMFDTYVVLGRIVGFFCITFYYKPILIPPTLVIFVVYFNLRSLYLASSIPMKHLEASSKAPLFSQLSSTFDGLITVRASQAGQKLMNEFEKKLDLHSSVYFAFTSSTRWLTLALDLTGNVFLALCTLSFLVSNDSSMDGDFGVALSACLVIAVALQYGIWQSAEMETWMTSAERILEYGQLQSEGNTCVMQSHPRETWPENGKIVFKDVSLNYDLKEKMALKGVSFEVEAGEKIGIVGRTGAGKSSLVTSLFRLAVPEGDIFIDGIDVSLIDLNTLRKNISIIPQDPLLFSGSLRRNLDPFDEYSDAEVWSALKEVHLHKALSPQEKDESIFSLDSVYVTEGGSNFSAGQRQLICLARAILKKSRILVMDEATANVDHEMDEIIQKTIREQFKSCTILTIAHRLHTILDSDKILVLRDGRVDEFDTPENLMANSDGEFTRLINSMDEIERAKILQKANCKEC